MNTVLNQRENGKSNKEIKAPGSLSDMKRSRGQA